MRLDPIQTNFTAGELSPLAYGRVDISKYHNAAKEIKNFLIAPQGGLIRRSGTRFVGEVKNSSIITRLVAFEFNDTQAYVMEFGQNYIRFYRNNVQIQNPPGTPVEIATPYQAADLFDLNFVQSADTFFIVHTGYPPQALTRTSDISWALTQISFRAGPFMTANSDATYTLTPSALTGTITMTASKATFAASDIGRQIHVQNAGDQGWCIITGYTSPTVVTCVVPTDSMNPLATPPGGGYVIWSLGSWSGTTGYPGAVSFFEQRLCFAGSIAEPQTFWMSQTNDFYNFSPVEDNLTVIDSDAINYTIASNKVNTIRWLDPASALIMGTAGAEWIIEEANTTEPLSPTNIQAIVQGASGSNNVQPRRVGSALIFVQRSGRKVKELAYQFAENIYKSIDLSVLSEHLLRINGGVVEMTFQQEPYSIVWFATNSGTLVGLTYMKEQEVVAWHQHVIGGSFNGGQAVVESVCSVPKSDASADQLYLIVKRTINGVQKRYIEYVEDVFIPSSPSNTSNMFFMDCGLTYMGPAVTSFTAPHLPASTLAVLSNGASQPQVTTDGSGHFTLAKASTNVSAGFPFQSTLQTLAPAFQYLTINNQGKMNRIDQIVLRFLNTLSPKYGQNPALLDVLQLRSDTDDMDITPAFFSGDFQLNLDISTSYDQSFYIVQDQPYPLMLLAIISHLVTYDKG